MRYTGLADNKLFGIHRYFIGDYHNSISFSCEINQDDSKISKFLIIRPSYEVVGLGSDGYIRELVADISDSPILDEPFFSPFVDMEAVRAGAAKGIPQISQLSLDGVDGSDVDKEIRSDQEQLRGFLRMKQKRITVGIWVATPSEGMIVENEFSYSPCEGATVRQTMQRVWGLLFPMIRESTIEFVAPFQIDFDGFYCPTGDYLMVVLRNGVYKSRKDHHSGLKTPVILEDEGKWGSLVELIGDF
ncbi:hypothetical protein TWF730_006268 [Orbilia blumenaviensis]|uniref:Uncharacterized protein n=1 Tax=Orbilia blumenaviensis TaxID=1796055 RepID=A0AAV9VK39_9PEZI